MKYCGNLRQGAASTGLWAVAATIAASFACRQVVDFREETPPSQVGAPPLAQTGTDAGGDAGTEAGAACGLSYGTSRCAACVSANCCQESSSCAADPACSPYAACAGRCAGDPTCRAQCTLDSPPGNSNRIPALSACLVAKCDSECGLTCGALASTQSYGGVPPDAAAACQSCIAAYGCDQARECGASVDCQARRLCYGLCATADCKMACDSAHDAGRALGFGTAVGPCSGACARGGDWSCVGHIGWPAPKSDTVTMTIQVKDYVSGSIFSGVDVSVCDHTDVDCARPRAHGSTNATGIVVLEVPNPGDSLYLGLDGYLQLTSPDDAGADAKILPHLSYWGFPLSEPEFLLVDSPTWSSAIRVLTLDDVNQLGASLGLPYDPSKSLLVAFPGDCIPHFAPGVQITTNSPDAGVTEVYGLSTSLTATDTNGFATLAGIPPGSVDVIATPIALGKPSSRQTVNVRAGWVTYVAMNPTP